MANFQFPNPADQTTVTNPETGAAYQWLIDPGKWVLIAGEPKGPNPDIEELQYKQQLLQNAVDQIYLDQQTGTSARSSIFSDTEPTVHPDFTAPNNALVAGDIWYDNTDLEQLIEYVYDGTKWILAGNYVKKKGGDTMEGQLIIDGPRTAGDDVDNPDLVSSVKVLSIDNAQNSSLQLRHSGNAKIYVGDTDISIASNIKFNRAAGSVVKSNVQDLLNIGEAEIAYLGQSIEDEDLITKKYVDDTKEFLQNEIIELEEELEALAPSLERGTWAFNPTGAAGISQFGLFAAGTSTNEFPQADALFINSVDSSGAAHNFTDVNVDSYVEIFDGDDDDYGLYQIKVIHDETSGSNSFWHFEIEHIRSNRLLAQPQAFAVCRFKFFELGEGADPSSFVVKVGGDEMQGPLKVTGPRSADLDNGSRLESTVKVLNIDSGQNSSLNLKWNGNSKVYVGDEQTAFQGHIKFNVAGKQIYSGDNANKKGLAFYDNGVQYVGNYTADKHLATKKNVEEAIYHDITDTNTNKYVDRAGDKMSGDLFIDRTTDGSTDVESRLTIEGSRPSSNNAAAVIKFINDQTTATGFLTYRSGSGGNWFAFNRDLDLNNNGLHSVARIRIQPGGHIGAGNNPRLTFNNASSGQEGEGLLVVPRPSANRRGFAIRGNDADGNEQDMLYTYTNYSGTADAINYRGKMDSGQNIVTKAYVDDALDFSKYPELS